MFFFVKNKPLMFKFQSGLNEMFKSQDMKPFWLRQALKESQSLFLRLSGLSLCEAFDLHFWLRQGAQGVTISVRSFVRPVLVCLELLFFIFWHQILQDDFRSVSGLSVLTSSDRRSLKYFVLFCWVALVYHSKTF